MDGQSVHLCHNTAGGAFDADLFRYACELGAQTVRVKDIETDCIYTTDKFHLNATRSRRTSPWCAALPKA